MAKRDDRKGQAATSSEFEEKVLYINRCSKVVKGGRKFSFSALILVGNKKGKVGYGFAKANEVSDAIRKGTEAAKKNVFSIVMEGTTIPHEIVIKSDGAQLLLKPAREGTGIVAGSVVRSVLEFAGFKDILAKSLGSNNPLNLVLATMSGLQKMKGRQHYLAERGLVG